MRQYSPLFAVSLLALAACSAPAEQTASSSDALRRYGHPDDSLIYCPEVDPRSSITDYSDPGDYFAKLSSAGFVCSEPHMFLMGTSDTSSWGYLDYAVCADSRALRAFVSMHNPQAQRVEAGVAFVEDDVCTATLPRAASGQVYVMWTPSPPRYRNREHCAGGCLLPKLAPEP